jgi:hypothetical protein
MIDQATELSPTIKALDSKEIQKIFRVSTGKKKKSIWKRIFFL